jgi:hypothetical protein
MQHPNIPKIRRKLILICDHLCSISNLIPDVIYETKEGQELKSNIEKMLELYRITCNSIPK